MRPRALPSIMVLAYQMGRDCGHGCCSVMTVFATQHTLRIWYLQISDLGTVISIHENPFPRKQESPESGEQKRALLSVVRRNVRLIFAGASKQHAESSARDSLVTIRIRQLVDPGPNHARIKQEDGPSLLFYYIFDDWASSYGIIVKREHPYGSLLDDLVRLEFPPSPPLF